MALPSPHPPELQDATQHEDAPAVAAKKAAKTPYFLFSEENREAVKQSLLEGKAEGTKISVADVAKELGARWKQLSAEEREQYKVRCQEALAAQKAAGGEDNPEQDGAEAAPAKASRGQGGLPLSLVKRIACLDEDVTRLSQDAVLVLAHATELFLEQLSSKCCQVLNSSKPKRSTIKLDDLKDVVKRDKRLVNAGLRDVLTLAQQHADAAAEQRATEQEAKKAAEEANADGQEPEGAEGEEGAAQKTKTTDAPTTGAGRGRPKKAKTDKPPAVATKPITAFFARRQE